MAKIYLSSTYNDLVVHREKVCKALRMVRHDVIAMEDYGAYDDRPLDKCLKDVADCDIYVAIFAWRYGYIPSEGNPDQKSITELEYRKACELGKPCLIFILAEDVPWRPLMMDMKTGEGEYGKRINAFRQELVTKKLVKYFCTPEELAGYVNNAVYTQIMPQSYSNKSLSHEVLRMRYLERICDLYSFVTLPLGANRKFSLHAVFQPLELQSDPLTVKNAMREKQEDRREAREGDNNDLSSDHRIERKEKSSESKGKVAKPIIVKHSEEALKQSRQNRVVILGGPGMGKTTTLEYLISMRAKEALNSSNAPIPIYLSMDKFASSGKTLRDYLSDLLMDMGVDSSYANDLWKAIEVGQAFLCLDSLDEVNPQVRSKIIDTINRETSRTGNTWIIGSRFTEYREGQFKQNRFTEWKLLPMDHASRLELARRLLPEIQQENFVEHDVSRTQDEFVSILEQHPQTISWQETPLLFSLVAVVFVRTGGLPPSRAVLYREVIEAVFSIRERPAIIRQQLFSILSAFALWLYEEKRASIFSKEELRSFLKNDWGKLHQETAELVDYIVDSSLVEANEYGKYDFKHRTFLEYLVAVELAQRLISQDLIVQENTRGFIWKKRIYGRWSEILRLMVGVLTLMQDQRGEREVEHWLKRLTRQRTNLKGDPGSLCLRLALSSLAERGEVHTTDSLQMRQLQIDIVSAWVEELLEAARRERGQRVELLYTQVSEVSRLPKQVLDNAQNVLVKAFDTSNEYVRWIALRLLGQIGKNVPLDQIFALLNNSAIRYYNPDELWKTLEMLGRTTPLDALLEAAQNKNDNIRLIAVRMLKGQGEHVSLNLLNKLLQDRVASVQIAAIKVLETKRDPVPITSLIFALKDDKPESVRLAALKVLEAQRERIPIKPLLHALLDKSTVRAAEKVLKVQGEHFSLEPWFQDLHEENHERRKTALKVLEIQGERLSGEHLLQMLENKNSDVRLRALEIVKAQKKNVLIENIVKLLKNKEWKVRLAAVEALEVQEENIPVEPLFEALQDKEWKVYLAAAEVLAKMEEFVPLGPLYRSLNYKMKGERAFKPLRSLWRSEKEREKALDILSLLGEWVPIEPLQQALKSRRWAVRLAAMRALTARAKDLSLDYLLQYLSDQDPDVRKELGKALSFHTENISVELLINTLNSENRNLRFAALDVLENARVSPKFLIVHFKGNFCFKYLKTLIILLILYIPLRISLPSAISFAFIWRMGIAIQKSWKRFEVRRKKPEVRRKRVPVTLLTNNLQHENWRLRRRSVKQLKAYGESVPRELWLQALQDYDERIRKKAVEILNGQQEHVFLPLLLQIVQDKDRNVNVEVVKALGRFGEHVSLQTWLEMLRYGSWFIRQAAIKTAGTYRIHLLTEEIVNALGDTDRDISHEAAKALRKVAPDALAAIVPEAQAILRGQSPGLVLGSITKSRFADVVGDIEHPSRPLLDELKKLLDYHYWRVQVKAAQALGERDRNIFDPDIIKRLLVLGRDQDLKMQSVQEAADDALEKILSNEREMFEEDEEGENEVFAEN